MRLYLLGKYKGINKKTGQPEDRVIAAPVSAYNGICKVEGCENVRKNGSSRCSEHTNNKNIANMFAIKEKDASKQ